MNPKTKKAAKKEAAKKAKTPLFTVIIKQDGKVIETIKDKRTFVVIGRERVDTCGSKVETHLGSCGWGHSVHGLKREDVDKTVLAISEVSADIIVRRNTSMAMDALSGLLGGKKKAKK